MTDLYSLDYDLKRAVSAFCDLAEDAKTPEDWDRVGQWYRSVLDLAQDVLYRCAEGVGI